MSSIFVLYNIDNCIVVGCYSSLSLAISNGQNTLGCCINWCIIENKLDNKPIEKICNVYQNDIDIYN